MTDDTSVVRQDYASKEEQETSLLDLLIVLAERKRFILFWTLSFTFIAVVVALLLPVRYTATVTILPPQQQNSSISSALTSQLGSMAALAGGSLGIKNPNDMYIAMFKSRTVEEAMVQHFGLMQEYHTKYLSDARKVFENNTLVDGSGKDGMIHISITDRDPKQAAAMANGYIDQFRVLSAHLAVTEASQRRLFFQQQLEESKNKLADADEAFKNTQQNTGLIQVDSQARALIEAAASLRAKIAAQEVIIHGMQTYATDQNVQLVQEQQELASLRGQLAQLGGSEGASDDILIPRGKVPAAGLEYARKLRDVKYQETIFEILARQFELAKLDEAKEGALIQVVDSAVTPEKRSSPNRSLIVISTSFVGFLLGVLFVLLQAAWKNLQTDPNVNGKIFIFKKKLGLREA